MAEQTSLVRATSLCHGALSQRFQSSGRVHRVKPVPSHSRCASTASLLCSNGSGEESQNTDFLEGWQFSSRHLQTVYMWRTDCQRRDTLQNAAGTCQKTTNKNTKRSENTIGSSQALRRGAAHRRSSPSRPHPQTVRSVVFSRATTKLRYRDGGRQGTGHSRRGRRTRLERSAPTGLLHETTKKTHPIARHQHSQQMRKTCACKTPIFLPVSTRGDTTLCRDRVVVKRSTNQFPAPTASSPRQRTAGPFVVR